MGEIYTHDIAAQILECFEETLLRCGITVPSSEDDERESDNDAALYGDTYWDLLDEVEGILIETLDGHTNETEVVSYVFS